jgi:hypothetical protein
MLCINASLKTMLSGEDNQASSLMPGNNIIPFKKKKASLGPYFANASSFSLHLRLRRTILI